MKAYLLAAMLVGLAAPALADEPAQHPAPDKPKLICRTDRSASLIRRQRICLTKEDWDRLAAKTARDLENQSRDRDHSQAGMVPSPMR